MHLASQKHTHTHMYEPAHDHTHPQIMYEVAGNVISVQSATALSLKSSIEELANAFKAYTENLL